MSGRSAVRQALAMSRTPPKEAPAPRARRPVRPDPTTPRFLPERAFVVQLESPARAGRRMLRGKVEHLSTGEARHFGTLAALAEFLKRFRGGER